MIGLTWLGAKATIREAAGHSRRTAMRAYQAFQSDSAGGRQRGNTAFQDHYRQIWNQTIYRAPARINEMVKLLNAGQKQK